MRAAWLTLGLLMGCGGAAPQAAKVPAESAAPVVRAAVEGAPVEDHTASSVATTTAPSPAAPRMALAMRVLAALCTGMLLCFLGLALYPRRR